jgi:hypothetical protein
VWKVILLGWQQFTGLRTCGKNDDYDERSGKTKAVTRVTIKEQIYQRIRDNRIISMDKTASETGTIKLLISERMFFGTA